jgi:peptide chain release factor 1
MGESGGGSWISDIISWHVHSLHGGNRSGLGSGNSFLEHTKIGSEGGLISYSGWDTSKKGRHLRAGLGESEDVVDEQQHILVLFVSEVLSDGETSESDSGSGTRGLVHLSVDESGFGAFLINLDDTGFNHFVVKIVSLSGSLSDSSEDRVSSVLLGNVVNQLHNKHSLSDSGTTEKSNFTSLVIGGH